MIVHLLLTLLLVGPMMAAPEVTDSRPLSVEEADPQATALSGEQVDHHLDLEDPISWSASTEVLDENHAWYRRRRSLDTPTMAFKPNEGITPTFVTSKEVMEAAESVVFMPAHLRRKKKAFEECKKGAAEFQTWRRTNAHSSHQPRWSCNQYCCSPVVLNV